MSLMGLGCGMDFDSEKAYRQVHRGEQDCGRAGAGNLRHPLAHGECRVFSVWRKKKSLGQETEVESLSHQLLCVSLDSDNPQFPWCA